MYIYLHKSLVKKVYVFNAYLDMEHQLVILPIDLYTLHTMHSNIPYLSIYLYTYTYTAYVYKKVNNILNSYMYYSYI